jgi:hypothetical protein
VFETYKSQSLHPAFLGICNSAWSRQVFVYRFLPTALRRPELRRQQQRRQGGKSASEELAAMGTLADYGRRQEGPG